MHRERSRGGGSPVEGDVRLHLSFLSTFPLPLDIVHGDGDLLPPEVLCVESFLPSCFPSLF